MAGKNSWLLPLAAGVGLGWFFSGTISNILGPIAGRFGVAGGHVGYAYPAQASMSNVPSGGRYSPYGFQYVPQPERRSFDRSYDSWLHSTVNAIPTQA